MAFSYLKTFHGILSIAQFFLGAAALIGGYFLWNPENREVYWLFFMAQRPLVTVVLAILVVSWLISLGVLLQQVFVKDLLEQMGKTKLLLLHAANGLIVLLAAVIESYYVHMEGAESSSSNYYLPRLIVVMVCCWLLFLTYIGQFIFVVLQ